MVGKFTAIVLAVLLFCSFTIAKDVLKEKNKAHKHDDDTIDIDDLDGYPMADESTEGSGPDDDTEIDGDDEWGSGTGAIIPGSGVGPDVVPVPVTNRPSHRRTTLTPSTRVPLTPCQQLHVSSSQFKESYVPRCTKTGEFAKTQCRGNKECWCVDPEGKIIKGTEKEGDVNIHRPDCEGGSDLTPCIYLRVKSEWEHLLGAFTPRCTDTGEFEKVQCRGQECWCADVHGRVIPGSKTQFGEKPNCEGPTDDPMIDTGLIVTKTARPVHGVPTKSTDIDNQVGLNKPDDGDDPYEREEENTNNIGKEAESKGEPGAVVPASIMGQPGILAGIIGGAVVGLLCAILLVMFIVYRMRKKDEGSYALDEPTKARGAYAYQKAPDREYYA